MTSALLSPADFPAFFEQVWKVPPFPWQRRLAEQVAERGWPPVLALPTACGKTAAIDVAIFHLALEAKRHAERRAPLRVIFVVDRRLVVDSTYERARALATALESASPADGVVGCVASRLRELAGPGEPPLRVARLRGGAPMEPDWARTPCQPTVCVSTVDQAGSRLLFRGYGVSPRMWPVHAGLFGSDTLFFLDEAHLSQPFVDTLRAVGRFRSSPWVEKPGAPLQVVPLSATLGEEPAGGVIGLTDEDRATPALRDRLAARKPTMVVRAKASSDALAHLGQEFAEHAWTQSAVGGGTDAQVVAVVVNRVSLARAVFENLRRKLAERPDGEAVLLIGRTREIDRARLLDEILPRMRAGREGDGPPLFVVATQCVEAGADLDFDALISQVSPLDCLRQRFGRLDRLGRRAARGLENRGLILAAADETKTGFADQIYGPAVAHTWAWLQEESRGGEVLMDFGVDALCLPKDAPRLLAPRVRAPILLPAYLDAWASTSPAPAADPDVATFLHGPEAGPGDVEVVWRADLAEDDLGDSALAAALVGVIPPSSLEAVAVPVFVARAWLQHRSVQVADVEGAGLPADSDRDHTTRSALRWRGPDDPETRVVRAEEIRAGDLIVVPAAYGGCDQFGWAPSSDVDVEDVAEEAALRQRRRVVLRLDPALLAQTRVAGSAGQLSAERLTDCIEEAGDDPQGLPAALLALAGLPSGWRARLEILERVPSEVIWPRGTTDARCALVARKRLGRQLLARLTSDESLSEAARALCRVALGAEEPAEPTTETTLGSFGAEVTLARHSRDVREKARAFGARCGLPESLTQDVALAAFLHDAGKAERRFQAFLRGGDELDAIGRPPLAKSAWEPGVQLREARRRSRLPDGARHEAWSVRLAESLGALGSAHDPDLVLWLIGTHHGFGRPFFPPIVDGDAGGTIELDLEDGVRMRAPVDHGLVRLDAGWVERFERLRRRYGPWGLARLEAILRLADHRASEEEAAGGLPAASAEAHRHG